jgi:hypothetical protein
MCELLLLHLHFIQANTGPHRVHRHGGGTNSYQGGTFQIDIQ